MPWIKEVEVVESVDDLKSSRSIRGIPGPDFEVLDAKIAPAPNRIIQNTALRKRSVWRTKKTVAREMGSPRHVHNRRRRTREGPEPACVQTPLYDGVAHAGREG